MQWLAVPISVLCTQPLRRTLLAVPFVGLCQDKRSVHVPVSAEVIALTLVQPQEYSVIRKQCFKFHRSHSEQLVRTAGPPPSFLSDSCAGVSVNTLCIGLRRLSARCNGRCSSLCSLLSSARHLAGSHASSSGQGWQDVIPASLPADFVATLFVHQGRNLGSARRS